MERPIIVLGAPRSGTSMTAGMLHHCGAWVGVCRGANEHNPKGYFENYAIGRLRKRYALTIENVQAVLDSEGYEGGPWVYKSSPWGWKAWEPFEPTFVVVRRPIRRSFESWCRKRPDLSPQELMKKLTVHNRQLDQIPGITVQADDLVRYRIERIRLVESVGLKYTREADEFVDVTLWH